MIRKDDLAAIAKLKGLALRLAELDYLQDIALLSLSRECGDRLVFKGGTCLSKAYRLNRFSEDLDFTAQRGFKKEVFGKLPAFFGLLNIGSKMEVEDFRNTINASLEVRGPLYDGSKQSAARLLFNISMRERVLLPVKRYAYAPLYQELRPFDLWVMDEREILAEKVRAIHERNKARDVYDAWYLLQRLSVPFDRALSSKKLSALGLKLGHASFMAKVKEKETSWKRDLAALVAGELPRFEDAQQEIGRTLE